MFKVLKIFKILLIGTTNGVKKNSILLENKLKKNKKFLINNLRLYRKYIKVIGIKYNPSIKEQLSYIWKNKKK
jgi:hypothetical protein